MNAPSTPHDQSPVWDLSDLYPSPSSPEVAADLDAVKSAANRFRDAFRGKVANLDGAAFGSAIAEYEGILEILGRLASYGDLLQAGDALDSEIARFSQGLREAASDIDTEILFFQLEINHLDDNALEIKMQDPAAAHYAPWVRELRLLRRHQLSDDLERLFAERDLTSSTAWVRLFDETEADLRFLVGDKRLTLTKAQHLLSDPDRAKREQAAHAIEQGLTQNLRLFSLTINTRAKDKEISDRWRQHKHPWSARNLQNSVEDQVVDALAAAVRGSYADIPHRYYTLKAKWLGLDRLEYWDRNAPLPDVEDRTYSWAQARDMVLSAYGRFSPTLTEIGKRFFDNSWIDVMPRDGKAAGAFAHPTVPKAHPYLLLNYMGRGRDVMTLAHELGHGVHQVLAADQGLLMSHTPLTLAETASVFGEMMTFRALLATTDDPLQRRALLAAKVEDMINTVARQISFYEFEKRLHLKRRAEGELTPERIGALWIETQAESLGPAVRLDEGYACYWCPISHFIHAPFYVYAYAFGDCLVNALYAVYEQGLEGFEEKYLEMLAAGGSLHHRELLAPFGLNAADPQFWQRGLSVASGLIDELERL